MEIFPFSIFSKSRFFTKPRFLETLRLSSVHKLLFIVIKQFRRYLSSWTLQEVLNQYMPQLLLAIVPLYIYFGSACDDQEGCMDAWSVQVQEPRYMRCMRCKVVRTPLPIWCAFMGDIRYLIHNFEVYVLKTVIRSSVLEKTAMITTSTTMATTDKASFHWHTLTSIKWANGEEKS